MSVIIERIVPYRYTKVFPPNEEEHSSWIRRRDELVALLTILMRPFDDIYGLRLQLQGMNLDTTYHAIQSRELQTYKERGWMGTAQEKEVLSVTDKDLPFGPLILLDIIIRLSDKYDREPPNQELPDFR